MPWMWFFLKQKFAVGVFQEPVGQPHFITPTQKLKNLEGTKIFSHTNQHPIFRGNKISREFGNFGRNISGTIALEIQKRVMSNLMTSFTIFYFLFLALHSDISDQIELTSDAYDKVRPEFCFVKL